MVLVEILEQRRPIDRILVHAGIERLEEGLLVRDVAAMARHGLDARLHPRAERMGVGSVRGDVCAQLCHVGPHELLDIHGQQRAVQIEKHRAIRTVADRFALFHS